MAKVADAARAAAERLEALQAGYASKYPEGIQKLATWLGARCVARV